MNNDRRNSGQQWPPQPPRPQYGPQWNPERYDPEEHARRATQRHDARQAPTRPARQQPPTRQQQAAPPALPARPAPRRPQRRPLRMPRFPVELLPRGRGGRGHSIGFYLYFGRHWIAGLITLWIFMATFAIVAGWMLLVVAGWALCCAAVTIAWLFQGGRPARASAVAAARRR